MFRPVTIVLFYFPTINQLYYLKKPSGGAFGMWIGCWPTEMLFEVSADKLTLQIDLQPRLMKIRGEQISVFYCECWLAFDVGCQLSWFTSRADYWCCAILIGSWLITITFDQHNKTLFTLTNHHSKELFTQMVVQINWRCVFQLNAYFAILIGNNFLSKQ